MVQSSVQGSEVWYNVALEEKDFRVLLDQKVHFVDFRHVRSGCLELVVSNLHNLALWVSVAALFSGRCACLVVVMGLPSTTLDFPAYVAVLENERLLWKSWAWVCHVPNLISQTKFSCHTIT